MAVASGSKRGGGRSARPLGAPRAARDCFWRASGLGREYPAKIADYLAIGIAELGNISERRLERLVNPVISGLPAFLARDPGLDSG